VVGTYGGVPTGGAPNVYHVSILYILSPTMVILVAFVLQLEFHLAYDYPNRRWGYWHRFNYVTDDYTEWLYIEDFNQVSACVAHAF
jgi:hypothetical protein